MRVLLIGPPSVHVDRWQALVRELGWACDVLIYEEPPAGTGRIARVRAVLRARRAIRQAVRATRPDLVHAHWLTGPAWAAALARAQPLVVSAWGSDALVWTPASLLARLLARVVARRAVAATYDTDSVADALARVGFPRERLHRVVFGADTERFRPLARDEVLLARLGAPTGVPVVLSPRGLSHVYRPETVVRAFAQVERERAAVLLIRASRSDPERLRGVLKLATELGVRGLIPYDDVPEDDLPRLLASADVVVSVPESDGTSVVLLETLATGVPIVASDLPANREWISADSGWLVPVGDSDALALALQAVLDDPGAARSAVAPLASHARLAGSRETQLKRVRELYGQLVVKTA